MSTLLENIYNPQFFRTEGHKLVDLLADHLEKAHKKEIPVNDYMAPEDQYVWWQKMLADNPDPEEYFRALTEKSMHLHHPHYMGHQISPPAPISALTGLLADLLNNGMGVYEMGGPSTAIERLVITTLAHAIGFDHHAGGFLTSGGTLANLTALLTARSRLSEQRVWSEGYEKNNLAVFVSEQAHYCIDRAARIMGLGDEGIYRIPVDRIFRMNIVELEKSINQALSDGKTPLAIVGSACTTSTGAYDPLDEIGQLASHYGIWFHVDGAHGGAAVFSPKYRHKLTGVEMADSIAIDGHKMMMTPSIITALIYKDGAHSFDTFRPRADYLFQNSHDEEWYNMAKRTFECTKLMMSIKFYSIIAFHGTEAWSEFVTTLYDQALHFAQSIQTHPAGFELLTQPQSNILCFRKKLNGFDDNRLNELNEALRDKVLKDGRFYLVQTRIHGVSWLRITLMNPFSTINDIRHLLADLEKYTEEWLNNFG